jgi:transcriptional regulator of arginine metabolism
MRVRAHRLKLIERLIEDKEVGSQDQLQEMLKAEGFNVTQATLSRDLHRLKAYRVVDDNNNLRYILPRELVKPLDAESKSDVARGCLSMTMTGNLVVVRTPTGFADMFAIAFERLALKETLGVIAGKDTVFIAVKEGTDVDEYKAAIKRKVPELKLNDTKNNSDDEESD